MDRLRDGLAERAGQPVLKNLGERPEHRADQGAKGPGIFQEPRLHPRFDIALKVHAALIAHAELGGAHLQIARNDRAVDHAEAGQRFVGATLTQAGRERVEHRRKNAEDRDVPDNAVAQVQAAEALPGINRIRARRRDRERARQRAFQPVGL